MKTIVELYKRNGQWRWRMRDYRNKKIIGASTEGYKRRVDAIKNLNRIGEVNYASWLKLEGELVVET